MAEAPARPVHVVAVIGAGVLGRSIAQAVALAGYRTILEDLLPNTLRRAQAEIRGKLDAAVARGELTRPKADASFQQIEYAGSLEDAARAADLVIEAIPDELESKIEIFTLLDKICRPQTILITNTFALSIREIASVTFRPQNCVGMRIAHPERTLNILEIVRTRDTDDETLATAAEVGRRMGKDVIIVEDAPISQPHTTKQVPARNP